MWVIFNLKIKPADCQPEPGWPANFQPDPENRAERS